LDNIFKGIDNGGFAEEALACDAAAFAQVVRTRRSVRVFKPEAIPDEVVKNCLELALLAPNSSNLQTWKFFVINSPEKRAAMNAACLSQPAATTAPCLIVCCADLAIWRAHCKEMLGILQAQTPPAPKGALDYYGKLVPLAYTADPFGVINLVKKIVVTLSGFFKPTPRQPTSHADLRVWAHKSAALACENLMLAFRAHGYDTCPMEGLDSARVLNIIGAGSNMEVVMAISAGKRDKKGIYGPRIRFDSKRFIEFI
jgi:nitroreductase